MSSTRTALLAVMLVAAGLAGCDRLFPKPPAAAPAKPTAAVVDLVAVAKAVGRDEAFKEQVESANTQLRQKLTEYAASLQNQLAEQQAALGESPTDEQRQAYEQLVADAQQKYQRGQGLAEQRAREFRQLLARQFREQVLPVVEKVASARGAAMVVTLSDTVLWYQPATDITAEVIAELRANPLPPPATPRVDVPAEEAPKAQ